MATNTTNIGLEKTTDGDVTWGDAVRNNWDLVDEAVVRHNFAEDTGNRSGSTFAHKSGRIRNNNVIADISSGAVSLSTGSTNFVEASTGGVVASTGGFSTGAIPLFQVDVGSTIAGVLDKRSFMEVDVGGGGGGGGTALTTKGDVLTHDGSSEVRLPVGSDGQILQANSSATNGVIWSGQGHYVGQTAGAFTCELIETVIDTDTGTTFDHTFQSYGTYDMLQLMGIGENHHGSDSAIFAVQLNGDTSSNYARQVNDGTTGAGLSQLDILSVPADEGAGVVEGIIRGSVASDPGQTYPAMTFRGVGVYTTSLVYVGGQLRVDYKDITSVKLFANVVTTGKFSLFGINFS